MGPSPKSKALAVDHHPSSGFALVVLLLLSKIPTVCDIDSDQGELSYKIVGLLNLW